MNQKIDFMQRGAGGGRMFTLKNLVTGRFLGVHWWNERDRIDWREQSDPANADRYTTALNEPRFLNNNNAHVHGDRVAIDCCSYNAHVHGDRER